MSAYILGSVSHEDPSPGGYYHHDQACSSSGPLGSWSLQRFPHQLGCWYVQLHIRGMCVTGYAVQDDFGALQMVAV